MKRIEIRASFKKVELDNTQNIQPNFATIGLVLRPEWAESWINGWKTIRNYAKVFPGTCTVKVSAPGFSAKEVEIKCPPEGFCLFVSLEDYWTPPTEIAEGVSCPSAIRDRNGLYRLFTVKKIQGVDKICELISNDALHWSEPEPLPVNCTRGDRSPHLIEAEDGRLVLLWESNRGESEEPVYCLSTSLDGRIWTDASIVKCPCTLKSEQYFACYALWQDSDGLFWIQSNQGALYSKNARDWTWIPYIDGKMHMPSQRFPYMSTKDNKLQISCRTIDGQFVYGREAVRELKMRKGESRMLLGEKKLSLLMLPDEGFFACGVFGLGVETVSSYETSGLASVAYDCDGEKWTTPYRHNTGGNVCFVWDGDSRIVYIKEKYSRDSSEQECLIVSFCDIDKLGGMPEENPTKMRVLSPAGAVKDPNGPDRILMREMYQICIKEGRLFCTLNGATDAALGEIDPITGKCVVRVYSGIKINSSTGPNWCDSDGKYLWVATQQNGLIRLGLNDGKIKWYHQTDGLISDNVCSVNCLQGKVYIGTLSGLNILNPDTEEITSITKDNGMPDNSICCVEFQGDIMWLGTVAAGVIMRDNRTGKWTHFPYDHEKIGKGGPDLLSDHIPSIFIYGDSVFFASYGIAEYDIIKKEWKHYLRAPIVSAVIKDGDLLWCSSPTDGIFTFNMNTKEIRKHFIRTPSYSSSQSNPNFSHGLDLLGDEVFITCFRESILAVSKKELMQNSFAYEEWKKVHISVPKNLIEKQEERRQ